MSTTLKSKDVITRKSHSCFACCRKFPEGTKMQYQAGIWEGDFCTTYCCMTCVEIMSLSDENQFEGEFVADNLAKDETPEQMLENIKFFKTQNP